MGVGNIQMRTTGSAKPQSRSIQNKITDVQQQMQKLSSREELSVDEKTTERKKFQKELASLNTRLDRQENEQRRSQKRELLMEELRESMAPADTPKEQTRRAETTSARTDAQSPSAAGQSTGRQETVLLSGSDGVVRRKDGADRAREQGVNTEKKQADEPEEKNRVEPEPADTEKVPDTGLSRRQTHAMVSADTSVRQAGRLGTVITRTGDGIVILKGEIAQDERRNVDTTRKQAELEKLEQTEQKAVAFQFSVLSEADKAMRSAAEPNVTAARNNTTADTEKNAFLNATNLSREQQAAQQKFFVSFS